MTTAKSKPKITAGSSWTGKTSGRLQIHLICSAELTQCWSQRKRRVYSLSDCRWQRHFRSKISGDHWLSIVTISWVWLQAVRCMRELTFLRRELSDEELEGFTQFEFCLYFLLAFCMMNTINLVN
jgi:hypothetical protein